MCPDRHWDRSPATAIDRHAAAMRPALGVVTATRKRICTTRKRINENNYLSHSRQSLCGGGVPSSHPSLGLSVFFLFYSRQARHRCGLARASTITGKPPEPQKEIPKKSAPASGHGTPSPPRMDTLWGPRAGPEAPPRGVRARRAAARERADRELSPALPFLPSRLGGSGGLPVLVLARASPHLCRACLL